MDGMATIVAFLALLAIVIGLAGVRIVKQAHVAMVERLGRFHKLLTPGVHVIIPVLEAVGATIDTREAVVELPPTPVITRDNITLQIDFVVFDRVVDPIKYRYEIQSPLTGISNLTATTLRNIIGAMDLDQILNSREKVNAELLEVLDKATASWGIKIMRIELKNIMVPPDVQQAMEQQMRAERDKRARILQAEGLREAAVRQAEGEKIAQITRAEGARQAVILQAEGEANAVVAVARAKAEATRLTLTAIAESPVDERVMSVRYVQALEKMAEGESSKLIIPAEAMGFLAAAAGIGEVLGAGAGAGRGGAAAGARAGEAAKGSAQAAATATEAGGV